MANQYDTNLKLQAIADAIGDPSGDLIGALEDIASAVGGGGGSSAGLVSDAFDENSTYAVGDYCIHNNTLYVCINAITTPGPWDLSDWQATNASIQLSSLNSALADLKVYQLQATIDYSGASGGNYGITNLPAGTVPIAVAPWQATDCNMTLFYSSTAHKWYIHCSSFQTGAMVTNASFTRVDVYYVKYTT